MTSDTNNPLRIRRPRRRRNTVTVPRQSLPITPLTWATGLQTCVPGPTLQTVPADPLSYVFEKTVLALPSFGVDDFIKDLRTRRRGDTALGRLGKEVFIALVLEPTTKALAEARNRC